MDYNLPVVICIGSLNVSGDSLGPLVGDILVERLCGMAHVYGTSKCPVNGVNLCGFLEYIEKAHKGSIVVAVDASVGAVEDVGRIKVSFGGVKAGGALKRDLPRVGHIGVIGIVAERGVDNLAELLAVPFKAVERLSRRVAKKVESLIILLSFVRSESA